MTQDFHLEPGYIERAEPHYFEDEEDSEWQPDVYPFALGLLGACGAPKVIDVGCGEAAKLRPFFEANVTVVGIDYGANISHCRERYPRGDWREVDLERIGEALYKDPHFIDPPRRCFDHRGRDRASEESLAAAAGDAGSFRIAWRSSTMKSAGSRPHSPKARPSARSLRRSNPELEKGRLREERGHLDAPPPKTIDPQTMGTVLRDRLGNAVAMTTTQSGFALDGGVSAYDNRVLPTFDSSSRQQAQCEVILVAPLQWYVEGCSSSSEPRDVIAHLVLGRDLPKMGRLAWICPSTRRTKRLIFGEMGRVLQGIGR
jgi:hypothetical protein